MSPRPSGQGAFTLRDGNKDSKRMMRPGWAGALDRWGPIPRGYGILVCGCRVTMMDGSDGGRRQWCLPLNPPPEDLRRRPVYSWLKEGDRCPQGCGQPIMRPSRAGAPPQPARGGSQPPAAASAPATSRPRATAGHSRGPLQRWRKPGHPGACPQCRSPWVQWQWWPDLDPTREQARCHGHPGKAEPCGWAETRDYRPKPPPTMWGERAAVAAERRQRLS